MNAFQLKVTALVFMVIDHVASFIPLIPEWLALPMQWVGRLAFPIFLFLVGSSCEHTHSRRNYLLRLYVAGVAMSFVMALIDRPDNIFTTLFQVALIITILKINDRRRKALAIACYVAYQAIVYLGIEVLNNTLSPENLPTVASRLIGPLLVTGTGSVYWLESGFGPVILGVLMWAVRRHAIGLVGVNVGYVAAYALVMSSIGLRAYQWLMVRVVTARPALANSDLDLRIWNILGRLGIDFFNVGDSLLTVNYQWMMVFAVPFMLVYNDRPGPRTRFSKWFFYVFYPAHIVVLWAVGRLIGAVA